MRRLWMVLLLGVAIVNLSGCDAKKSAESDAAPKEVAKESVEDLIPEGMDIVTAAKKAYIHSDIQKAKILLSKACESGDGMSCYWMGGLYKSGAGVKKDEKSAEKYFLKGLKLLAAACDRGDIEGCNNFGYYHDKDLDKDVQSSLNVSAVIEKG